ncbi:hypothetical protein MKK50_05420 [Methylobacterium sp. J-043]|nr:hypothetical protein [Methylobacterium sp. J-043]
MNANRILDRAARCPRSGSRILPGLLVDAFAHPSPVFRGQDDTIEPFTGLSTVRPAQHVDRGHRSKMSAAHPICGRSDASQISMQIFPKWRLLS